jgi:hypothetical protein
MTLIIRCLVGIILIATSKAFAALSPIVDIWGTDDSRKRFDRYPNTLVLNEKLGGSINRVMSLNPCLLLDGVIDENSVLVDTSSCNTIDIDPEDVIIMAVNLLEGPEKR